MVEWRQSGLILARPSHIAPRTCYIMITLDRESIYNPDSSPTCDTCELQLKFEKKFLETNFSSIEVFRYGVPMQRRRFEIQDDLI